MADVRGRGLRHISSIRSTKIYLFRGRLERAEVHRLAESLLVDPVIETYRMSEGMGFPNGDAASVEVHYRPGVMDPVAESTLRAATCLLEAWGNGSTQTVDEIRTAHRYVIEGARDAPELEWIARNVLANNCIEVAYIDGFGRQDRRPDGFPQAPAYPFEKRDVRLAGLDGQALAKLSRDAHLFLSVAEMEAIQTHFASLGRDPTDLELETLAQTWSEHCVHKTLKSDIVYRGRDFGRDGDVEVRFDNLLKCTIVAATERLDRDWCLSVFVDNAGVIAFDDEFGVAFKVETHNHPSAIEPYGGAATGAGGCIRDVLGCGLGAKPIASTDVFCLAPPDWPESRLPEGVLHPRRVLNGVVSGVRDYGNRMGIPTVNGAIYFDPRYLTNPLVFVGCVGLIPRDRIAKEPRAGDCIVLVGGRTGRDGIHGATFSSSELTDTHADEFSHAVQIGNPIEEKKVLDGILAARDHESGCLFNAITDCGAGGLSSAVGEMAEILGATVDLENVPLKYAGLRYDEIWISEAQERMVLAVSEDRLGVLFDVFAREEVEATVIGRFTGDGKLCVRYEGLTVGELDVEFLHHGLPKKKLVAEWQPPEPPTMAEPPDGTIGDQLLAALGSLNVASKEWVIRQYDHEVQAGSAVKPLAGPGAGPSDAAVLRPRLDSDRGIAIACGLCPELSDVDPYAMAIAAVDEALRNVICVGGDPARTAILDNFCWGEVESPRSLGALVRACRGAHDAAVAYGLPFISGKDSLNNQFTQSAEAAERLQMPQRVSIPDTLLISAISVLADVGACVTMDLKTPESRLVCVGGFVDRDLEKMWAIHQRVAGWIRGGAVLAAHDVSDGGLGVAVAEMCIAGVCGATLELGGLGSEASHHSLLFDEWRCCYVLESAPGAAIDGDGVVDIGKVERDKTLRVMRGGMTLAEVSVSALGDAWRAPLSEGCGVRRDG